MNAYYVTAVDGPQVFFLAGPYETKEEAETHVDQVRDIACDFSKHREAGRAWFMAYGVSRWKDEAPAPKSALGLLRS